MATARLAILYEDNHLLVVDKPAGVPTMGVAAGEPSMLELARAHVKRRYAKPGNVYLGVVSRLDAPVTGVLLFARTSKAAARLTAQFRGREVDKSYWALVEGTMDPPEGTLVDWLVHDDRRRKVHATSPGAERAKEARLHYHTLGRWPGGAWLEVILETGRKHQIRVQCARRGHPIAGDRKYGARTAMPSGIALHARRLALAHPVRREPLVFEAALPPSWRALGVHAQEGG